MRRPRLIPELQAIGGDLVVVDDDGALDKIQAAVGSGRVPLAIDGVASERSATIAGALSEHGIFVVYAHMGGGPVVINPFDLIAESASSRLLHEPSRHRTEDSRSVT